MSAKRKRMLTQATKANDLPNFNKYGNVSFCKNTCGDVRFRVLVYLNSFTCVDELVNVLEQNNGLLAYLQKEENFQMFRPVFDKLIASRK